MSDKAQVTIGKVTAIGVGGIAIVLGILFKNLNVSFLVGWAFAVAASANLPAIIMVLFLEGHLRQGCDRIHHCGPRIRNDHHPPIAKHL